MPQPIVANLEKIAQCTWTDDDDPDRRDPTTIEVLIGPNGELGGETLRRFPGLRLVICMGTAYDNVDLDYCRKRGIGVSNTAGYAGPSVAELAIGLMLSVGRRISEIDQAIQQGATQTTAFIAHDVNGRTAGIFGLGDIGKRVARACDALGMQVAYTNRSGRRGGIGQWMERAELFAVADVLFLTAPLDADTEKVINAEAIARMKNGAVLINVSADELVDFPALHQALVDGHLAGAGIDVIGDPTRYAGVPNLVTTHLNGWWTYECQLRWADTWAAALSGWIAGERVNPVL
ncbi:2-hydroxyacid dehydrogenase [Actinoplanes palleronii]|uniref:Uncharacterized protein n=1 Tax=Actinoplanes palleronii TaxID=113570 RepID=A0ABQ4B6P5_9ACTN|nr:2-hydroxyacid dehydrogenase [Actinoplanes palleronii]GIE66300.1 hypothetical protein Apa02nite_024080 [Actinoplanes palleronii]